jgi:hypothetical protein
MHLFSLRFFKPSTPLRFVFHFTLQKSSFPRQGITLFGNTPATAPRFWQQSGNKSPISAKQRQQHPVFGNVPATTGKEYHPFGEKTSLTRPLLTFYMSRKGKVNVLLNVRTTFPLYNMLTCV